jgi:hypothetical protein
MLLVMNRTKECHHGDATTMLSRTSSLYRNLDAWLQWDGREILRMQT